MKILHFPKLRTFLWIILLTQVACSPSLKEGLISYRISFPEWVDKKIPSGSELRERKLYFQLGNWAEVRTKDYNPLFHLHTHFDEEKGKVFEHKDYLGAYFLVEKEKAYSQKFVPLEGKKKILGYKCRKGQIISQRDTWDFKDTVIIWYTKKLPPSYFPNYAFFDRGLVLQTEEKPRMTEAISINATSAPEYLFKPEKQYKIVSQKEFEYIIKDLQPYQATERP